MLVRDVMTKTVVTARPDMRVKQAIELLDRHQVTALPVVDDEGRLVGVVSEADVLRDVVPADRRVHEVLVDVTGPQARLAVTDVMTHLPICVSPDEDIARAVDLLVDTQVKSLPVVQAGRVVGVLSRRDIIAVLARQDALIEAEVDEAIRGAGVECTIDVEDGVVVLRDAEGPEALEIAQVIASRVPGVVGVSAGGRA
jgi:CBS domain-containing protein